MYEKTGVKTNISYNDVAYLEVLLRAQKEDPYAETEHWDVKQRILWLNISRYMKKALKKDG
ncbi:MAG: hypothetical protein ACLR6I_12930 [Waltera sp.]